MTPSIHYLYLQITSLLFYCYTPLKSNKDPAHSRNLQLILSFWHPNTQMCRDGAVRRVNTQTSRWRGENKSLSVTLSLPLRSHNISPRSLDFSLVSLLLSVTPCFLEFLNVHMCIQLTVSILWWCWVCGSAWRTADWSFDPRPLSCCLSWMFTTRDSVSQRRRSRYDRTRTACSCCTWTPWHRWIWTPVTD